MEFTVERPQERNPLFFGTSRLSSQEDFPVPANPKDLVRSKYLHNSRRPSRVRRVIPNSCKFCCPNSTWDLKPESLKLKPQTLNLLDKAADRGFLDIFVVITSLWEVVTDILLAVQEETEQNC